MEHSYKTCETEEFLREAQKKKYILIGSLNSESHTQN